MDNLKGKIALVAGGTGGVGEGIVLSLMRQGAKVIVPVRKEEKATQLEAYVAGIGSGELVTLSGGLDSEEQALKLRDDVHTIEKNLDLVIVSVGGWWQGLPLTSIRMDVWNKIVSNNLTSHFLAVRAFVPLIHPKGGLFVHINGFSAEQPYPMAAPVAMMAAAQKSMVLTLSEELKPTNIKVHELILGPIKTRQRQQQGFNKENWYFPEEVGDYIADLVVHSSPKVLHYLLEKGNVG